MITKLLILNLSLPVSQGLKIFVSPCTGNGRIKQPLVPLSYEYISAFSSLYLSSSSLFYIFGLSFGRYIFSLFPFSNEMVHSFTNYLNIQFNKSPFYPGTSLHHFINKQSLSHSLAKLVGIQTEVSKPRRKIIH